MTTRTPTNAGGSAYVLDKVIAVALVAWLLFFGGFGQLKNLLAPSRLNQVAQVADTIKTGVGRVTGSSGAPAPAAQPRTSGGAPPAAPSQADIQATADAMYRATAQAMGPALPPAAPPAAQQPAAAPNASDPSTWPTAVIAVPTAVPIAQVTIVPTAYPAVYASNSPPTATPIPTIPYPTPLPPAAAAYTLSPDGKCVTVARSDGHHYQECQGWPYSDAEARSIADYLRTGLVPGTKVD